MHLVIDNLRHALNQFIIMAKVSVIVPNYNHSAYLRQRLTSIQNQTFQDFELLVLDDASTDTSRDVIREFAQDPRVHIIFNEVNSGNTFVQWAKGLAATTGEYVWIAESDDFADPRFLELLVPVLDADSTLGMAVSNSMKIDAAGSIIEEYFNPWRKGLVSDYSPTAFDEYFSMNGREYCEKYMVPWNTIPNASAVLFRRSALQSSGGPHLSMKICGDWYTYCAILLGFNIARVPAHLNYFRQHQQNVRGRSKGADYVKEALHVLRYVAKELGRPFAATLNRILPHFAQAIVGQERRPPDNKVPLMKHPIVLRRAAEWGSSMFLAVAGILIRELLAKVAQGLGIRPRRQSPN